MGLPDWLTLAMFACFIVAAFLLAIWVGFVILGLVLFIIGLAMTDGKGVPWQNGRS